MNPILFILLLLALIPAIYFVCRSPRKNAIKRCVAIVKKIKRTADYAGQGDESALDEYREFLELTQQFNIADDEINIQNKTVVAQQALIAFTNFVVTCQKERRELLMQMAREFHDEYLEVLPRLVPHELYADAR